MDLSQLDWISAQQNKPESIILDVRTEEEFEAGHIPNAHLLDIRDPEGFMKGVSQLEADKRYFVYCRSGARSAQACQILKQSGIPNCFNLLGGILDWKGEVVTG